MERIDENKIKQGISEGCLKAIASYAGISIDPVETGNDYGADFYVKGLRKNNSRFSSTPSIFEIQLKSTTDYRILKNSNSISYPLRVKNYNDIVLRNIEDSTPIILAVMLLHEETENWCNTCFDNIVFQNSILYHEINDTVCSSQHPDNKIAIHIPVTQILTPTVFWNLLNKFDVRRIQR